MDRDNNNLLSGGSLMRRHDVLGDAVSNSYNTQNKENTINYSNSDVDDLLLDYPEELEQYRYDDPSNDEPELLPWTPSTVIHNLDKLSKNSLSGQLLRILGVKMDETKLNTLQEDVREGEANWNHSIKLAKEYLQYKQELLDAKLKFELNQDVWDDDTKAASLSLISNLQYQLKNMEDGSSYIDPNTGEAYYVDGLKSLARTNPYLQDIFYETRPGELFKNTEDFGGFNNLFKYFTHDIASDDKLFSDFNPGNNFKNMLSHSGLRTVFGKSYELTDDQLKYMWDYKNDDKNLSNQIEWIEEMERVNEARLADKNKEIQQLQHDLKHNNWLYDPTKIDPSIREAVDNNEISISNPESWLYAIPELGSSFSEAQMMLLQMGTSAAINMAAKSAMATTTMGVAPAALGVAEVAIQSAITNEMRSRETKAELFEAFNQKVNKALEDGTIDLSNIFTYGEQELKKRGFNTDEMNEQELLQNMLAQNIVTPDVTYNKLVESANRGLDVVRLDNQALMLGDLAQGMFMFGGQYLKHTFGLDKAIKDMGLGRTLGTNVELTVKRTISDQGLYKTSNGIIDRTIAAVANKVWSDAGSKATANTVMHGLVDTGKKLGLSYFIERTEEGQQWLTSQKYLKGDYDNIENYNMLDAAVHDLVLGVEANAAYYGIHPDENLNSNEELKKVMSIGGFTGLFLSGAYSSPSVYEYTRLAIVDNKMRGYIADAYGNAEMQNKVDQILSASGMDDSGYERVINNLQSIKENFKPEGITDEMIDENIDLVHRINRLTNNTALNELLDEMNINTKDKSYNRVIKNAISTNDRLKSQSDASQIATAVYDELTQKVMQDAGLRQEIALTYQQKVDEYNKRRSEQRRKIVNEAPLEIVQSLDKLGFSDWVDSKLGESKLYSEEEYINLTISRMLLTQHYNDLVDLRNQLSERSKTLEQIAEDKDLDVNVQGIRNIKNYVDELLKVVKKHMDDVFKEDVSGMDIDSHLSTSFKSQLTKATMSKYVNDGARADLLARSLAYITGRYAGSVADIKPTYNNLTEDQQKVVVTRGLLDDDDAGRPRRSKQEIIQAYDKKVEDEWSSDDNLADLKYVLKKRAKLIIQLDLNKKTLIEDITRQEILEEAGETSLNTEVILEAEEETLVTPTNTPAVSLDNVEEEIEVPGVSSPLEGNEAAAEDLSNLLDKLNESIEGEQQSQLIEMDSPEEISSNEEIDLLVLTENPIEAEQNINPTDIAEEVNDKQDDSTAQDQTANEVNAGDQTAEDPNSLSQGRQEVLEGEDTPSVHDTMSEIESTPNVEDVTETPNAANIYFDDQNQQIVFVGTGEDISNGIPVDDQDIIDQSAFDYVEHIDSDMRGPSAKLNDTENAKVQHNKLHIANTFFYLHTTDEVMAITVDGNVVRFETKDGNVAERRPGRELAEKLSQPGWLAGADDIYYVVSKGKHDMTGLTAIDNLAIHIMIEKDGKLYNASLRAVDQRLRERMLSVGMTEDEIKVQIDALRLLRALIINTYAPDYSNGQKLSLTALKHVKPTGLRISNGTLNNQTNDQGLPVFRSITEVGDFGLSSDPIKMSEQINSGEVVFGYGTGPFGVDPFSIADITTGAPTEVQGKGYAGKIFIIPDVTKTPSGTSTLPIMLSEELHRIPDVSRAEDLPLSRDVNGNGQFDSAGNSIPMSTAELIYELLVNGMTRGENGSAVDEFLLSLLANAGNKTFTNGFDNLENAKFNFLVRKQLGIFISDKGDKYFINGYLSSSVDGMDKYSTRKTLLKNISDTTRRQIIFEISKNIHWNTDKDVMSSTFPLEFIDFMLGYVEAMPHLFKDENSRVQVYSPELTFSLKDIGYTLVDNKPVKVGEPLVVSWMINQMKLKTDLGNHAFGAPFIYTDGVKVDISERQKLQATEQTTKPVSAERKTQTPVLKDTTKAELATPENLAKYGLEIPNDGRRESSHQKWAIVNKDGKPTVILAPVKFIKGLASSERGTGKFNESGARGWLLSRLGLSDQDLLITDSMIKLSADKEVYGLMTVVMDQLTGELMPEIHLSRQSGQGVEYHEAFHYVSQLLLSPQERLDLYQSYIDTHQDMVNASVQEVEEALADDFRNYVLDKNRSGFKYKIIKFFKNLISLLTSWNKNKPIYKAFFERIESGEFKNMKPGESLMADFLQNNPNGLAYYIPGMSVEEADNMPNITDPNMFYKAVDSLVSGALTTFNIKSIEDVHRLNTDVLFDLLQDNIDFGWISDDYVGITKDIIANKEVFKRYVRKKLETLGVREIEKQEREEAKITEENGTAENTWDKNLGEVSKKDNISFRAKLFFYSVPKYEYIFTRDEKTGVVSRELVPVEDDIFHLPVTESFDRIWNLLMEEMWDINDFNDLVTRTEQQGNTEAAFYAINLMLTSKTEPLSENMKTQLEITIKSAKVQQDTLETSHPLVSTRGKSEDEVQSDIEKNLKVYNFSVLDSDDLRKISRYPSRWSDAFFASSAVDKNGKGVPFITKETWDYIDPLKREIGTLLRNIALKRKKNQTNDEPLQLQKAKNNFLSICNSISIPMDNKSLDYLINMQEGVDEFTKFSNFWNHTNIRTKSNTFSDGILADIKSLARSGTSEITSTSSGESKRSVDRMFTSRYKDSQINQMAVAYGKTHPSPQEFSVVGADGALIYPISENNYMCDLIRNINQNKNGKRKLILDTPYSRHSIIVNEAEKGTKFKLHNFLMLKVDNDSGRDYFGITPIEDYICKLTLTYHDRMILPTMSDKKTWYSISGLRMVKDYISSMRMASGDLDYAAVTGQNTSAVTSYEQVDRSFSSNTLKIFANYWLDEFDAVWDYFSKKGVVEKNPTLRVDNYHGKIKNGKMDASGNGGRFRYFTRMVIGEDTHNINQDLAKLERNGTTEDVLNYLRDLKVLMLGISKPNSKEEIPNDAPLYKSVNNLLVDATRRELRSLAKRGILSGSAENYRNILIPNNIYSHYASKFNKNDYKGATSGLMELDIIFSIIGSHVANQAISIMEVEKCFTGDPAYYKWSKNSSGDIMAKDVDKTKRLSAVLSTGTNLRTIWDNPEENDTNVTVMHLADNELVSDYHTQLHNIFKNSILRDLYSEVHPDLSDAQVIDALNTEEKLTDFYNSLSDGQKEFVDNYSKASANPYDYARDKNGNPVGGNINQSDAAVYVRPALYRRIMKALGQWSDEIEQAYQIIEGEDESWLSENADPAVYQKALALVVKPLKMVYFGDHREGSLNLNIPVFDKMAMFPMFRVLAKADNKLLYDRMNNEELGVIDMLTFESAVKVGGRKKFVSYDDPENTKFNAKDLNKKSYNLTNKEGDLPVFVQDISNLRLQLNTDPHEHMDRSFGTQAIKIGMGNLIDNRTYGLNKGILKSGVEIKNELMAAINRLSDIGFKEILRRFYRDGKINNRALSDYLVSQAMSSAMPDEFIKGLHLDADGEFIVPLAAQSSRGWIESRLISYINKLVVDVNTPGGSAIQMSSYGFKSTVVRDEKAFNKGNKLRFLNNDGSMDVVLSINFFRHIVPKEYQTTFGLMKKWLLDHNIIGSESTPQGMGYRIPTQGLSSTFSFKVVDVLPSTFGDTIIVPDEFTAMTGSDFDVDKLYIAMLNYDKDGNIIQYEGTDVRKLSKEALLNKIIQNFQLIISDDTNMAETRASIDTLTKMLLKEVLPNVQDKITQEADPFYELLPSFLLARKEEYTGGKAGIGPFALNSTNHVLTQLMHLNMKYSHGNPYGLGKLDAIKGQDGFRILDWLSAMINAHVDVAKDPYIIALNVNQQTYNMTNLLLRGGKGITTFYFLAQPVLKEFANQMIASKGVYGVSDVKENNVVAALYNIYAEKLKSKIQNMPEGSNKEQWKGIFNGVLDQIELKKIEGFAGIESVAFNTGLAFNELSLKQSLKDKSDETATHLYQLLVVLNAYKALSNDAQTLADLVHVSQIDTKKFGNNLALHMNFKNSVEVYKYNNRDIFEIVGRENEEGVDALDIYFKQTFLSKKLHNATSLARKILKHQTFPATWVYEKIFTSVMGSFRGVETLDDGRIGYSHTTDKDLINLLNKALESSIRARLTRGLDKFMLSDDQLNGMFYGKNTMCNRLTKIKNYIRMNQAAFPDLIDEVGNITNELLNYLQELPGQTIDDIRADRIILSESSMNNSYDLENLLVTAFDQLLNHEDETIRGFAEDLVRYAYITSYDERGVNAFFHLVPLQYKIDNGYVSNMRDALNSFKDGSNDAGYDLVTTEEDNPSAMNFESIRVAIARNLWDDPRIVSEYKFKKRPESTLFVKGDFDTEIITVRGNIGKKTIRYYDAFATSYWNTQGKEFITVRNGRSDVGSTELYQLIGYVAYRDAEGDMVKRNAKAVYKRIPKLGIKDKGLRVFEYAKSGSELSAFKVNEFEGGSAWDNIEVLDMAMSKVKLPKVKDSELGLSKDFFPYGGMTVQVAEKASKKLIEEDPIDATLNGLTTQNSVDVTEIDDCADGISLNDFVNLSISTDTGLSIDDDPFSNLLNDMSTLATEFANSADAVEIEETPMPANNKRNRKNKLVENHIESINDLFIDETPVPGLSRNGAKRIKDCK